MHFTQRAGAVARREERLASASFVTNPTHAHVAVAQWRMTNDGNVAKAQHRYIMQRSLGPRATSSFLPLQADCFDNGGEWAAILSGNLGDVLGLRGRVRLLRFFGGIRFGTTGVITQGAR